MVYDLVYDFEWPFIRLEKSFSHLRKTENKDQSGQICELILIITQNNFKYQRSPNADWVDLFKLHMYI